MESVKFQKSSNSEGIVTQISISGFLTIENAQQLKKEFIAVIPNLNNQVKIVIHEVDDIDVSFVQLVVAFTRHVTNIGIMYNLQWNLDDEQRLLFENVGLSFELSMNQ